MRTSYAGVDGGLPPDEGPRTRLEAADGRQSEGAHPTDTSAAPALAYSAEQQQQQQQQRGSIAWLGRGLQALQSGPALAVRGIQWLLPSYPDLAHFGGHTFLRAVERDATVTAASRAAQAQQTPEQRYFCCNPVSCIMLKVDHKVGFIPTFKSFIPVYALMANI